MGVVLIPEATNSLKSWPDSLRYSFYFHIFLLLPWTWLQRSGRTTLATCRSRLSRSCLLRSKQIFHNLVYCPNQTTPKIGNEYRSGKNGSLTLIMNALLKRYMFRGDRPPLLWRLVRIWTEKNIPYQWLIVHALHVTMIVVVAARAHNEPAVHVALGSQGQVLGGT